ncbi:MAG: hypothetical protein GY830_08020 [Bacteroidetes bacterium]|nr:hypothetical protein [Bacteroidota bacterium]
MKTSGIEQQLFYKKMLFINKSLHDEKALKNVLRNLYQEYQNYQTRKSDNLESKAAFYKLEVMRDKKPMIAFIPSADKGNNIAEVLLALLPYFLAKSLDEEEVVKQETLDLVEFFGRAA